MISRVLSGLVTFVSLVFRVLVGRGCRFYPSCSVYARQALSERPLFSAAALITSRLLRCQPFSAGGYDPLNKA